MMSDTIVMISLKRKMCVIAIIVLASYSIGSCASKCPNGINGYGMTEQSRIDILFWHNQYRNELVEGIIPNMPKAQTMPEIFYNADLETEAQYFANHCHFEFENVTKKPWGQLGINLSIQVSKSFDRRQEWAQVLSEWWHEQDMYSYGKQVMPQAKNFGQMIWAKTEYIGCGFTVFPIKHPDFILFHKFYVCAYAPRGNIPGELPYKKYEGK